MTIGKSCFPSILFLLLFLTGIPDRMAAQGKTDPDVASERLWSLIETQLDKQPSDTSFQFILLLVRGHCDRDYDCLDRTYTTLMHRLERKFNLRAAIYVGEEIARITRKQQDREAEADVYLNIYRFHDALGNGRQAAISIEKALHLFERTGNQSRITLCKFWKLSSSLKHRKIEDVLPAIENLLDEATARSDSEMIIRLHKELVSLTHTAGQYDQMAKHLDALEAIARPDPVTPDEKYFRITILRGCGTLYSEKKHLKPPKGFMPMPCD